MATSESDGDASPAPGEMSLARVRRDPPPFAVDDDAENATAPRRSSPRRDTYPYATSTEEDRAAETMVSSSRNTLPASARTRSVSVPVFSVAGKRVSIDQLLREKVQQASKAGRHQVMSAFRTMRDGAGTRVGREDVRRCLARFNLLGASSSFDDDEVLDALFSRFDVDGDGAIDFKEFAGTLLPADFPSDLTEVDRRVANVALPLNGLMGKPKPPRDVATIRGRAGTAEGVEALLRAKLAEKFGESGAAMRRAFAAFDVDGDGVLRFDEFERVLRAFLIAPEPAVTRAIHDKRSDAIAVDSSRGVSFEAFADAFAPRLDVALETVAPDAKRAIRESVAADLAAQTAKLLDAFERKSSERKSSSSDERDASVALTLEEARAALGPDADARLVRALKRAADDAPLGLIDRARVLAIQAARSGALADAAVSRASRGYADGFGRELVERRGGAERGPEGPGGPATSAPEKVASAEALHAKLRDALARRAKTPRAAFAMIDRKRRGWFDSGDLARAIHRLNVVGGFEASALRGLMARYTSGSGRVTLSDFVGENGLGAAEDYPDGGFKLGGNSYQSVRAKTPPRFPKRLDASELEKVAREKFASKVPAGWSEAKYAARLFDPDAAGVVTLDAFRAALEAIGLGAVTAEDTRNLFQRIKGDDRVGEGDASASASASVRAFASRFAPRAFAPPRPAKAAVLAALESAAAATEDEVRAVLEACGVDGAGDDAYVSRLVRLCGKRDAATGRKVEGEVALDRVAAAVAEPESRRPRPGTPTPRVDHVAAEVWRVEEKPPTAAGGDERSATPSEAAEGGVAAGAEEGRAEEEAARKAWPGAKGLNATGQVDLARAPPSPPYAPQLMNLA